MVSLSNTIAIGTIQYTPTVSTISAIILVAFGCLQGSTATQYIATLSAQENDYFFALHEKQVVW
jgi:hypothetical protein